MPLSMTDDRVLLKHDVPELGLIGGAEGFICRSWGAAPPLWEIQFIHEGFGCHVLLASTHFERVAESKPEVLS